MDRYDELCQLIAESTRRHCALLDERWRLTPECPFCKDRRNVIKHDGKWVCLHEKSGIYTCLKAFE